MAKGAVDLDDRVMVFWLFPTCAFLCVMVNNKLQLQCIVAQVDAVQVNTCNWA